MRPASKWFRALALVPVALLAMAAPVASANGDRPSPGAPGGGDPLFPGLGNGGYDVRHYTLDLVYGSTAAVQTVPALATIDANATQSLSRFDLDFSGDSVGFVSVDGLPAAFSRQGEELVITPRRAITKGRAFTVRVGYTSGPREIAPGDENDLNKVLAIAWFATPSGSITAAQPNAAHRIFPSNDITADLATYTFHAITPAGSTFVANGELTGKLTLAGRTVWSYEEREPMASELIQLAFGALTVRDRGTERGVRLRDVAPTSQIAQLEPALASEVGHLDYMTDKVGRYPFRSYGTFSSDATFPFALEDQTLSLYPSFLFLPPFPPAFYEPIMVHELAHQWFGDSVTPRHWSDVWLNEVHATWYEWNYGNDKFGIDFVDRIHDAYAAGDQLRALYGPVAAPIHGADDVANMFSPMVYDEGAVALFALRQVIGEPAFEQLERRWVQRFAGGPASTGDFIALASDVSHRNLTAFLNAWLFGTTTPPMPGHPDWTVDPVGAPAPAALAAPLSAPALLKR